MGTSYQELVHSPLSLTQSATYNVVKKLDVSNTLELSQNVISNFYIEEVVDTLIFTQNISVNTINYQDVENTLELQHIVSKTSALTLDVANTLELTQNVKSNIKVGIASNQLELTQNTIIGKPIYVTASTNITNPDNEIDLTLTDPDEIQENFDSIGVRQEVSVNVVYNKSVVSYLNLTQEAARGIWETAANHIHLSQLAEGTIDWYDVNSIIQLNQTVDVYKVLADPDVSGVIPTSNELNLTQTIELVRVIEKSLTSTLNLSQAIDYFLKDAIAGFDLCPNLYQKTRPTILLTYPYVNAEYTVELRNPQFDDIRQIENRRINRKTRGGKLIVFRDPIWPQSERLIYSFDNLFNSKKRELLTFLEVSIGKEIGLLDFRSQQWRGVIITPTTQIGREDRPGNSITFEFEGTIDDGSLEPGPILSRFGNNEKSEIKGIATIPEIDLTKIPPGFQADFNVSGQLVGNVLRD